MPLTDVLAAVRAAPVAELAWVDQGSPQVRGVLPLVDGDGPVLALPYADATAARSIAASPQVVLTLTDPQATSPAYQPLRLRAAPRLVEDPDGDRFCRDLLTQELRRWPPSRVLADSILLRRENWWWLPRLLVELEVRDVGAFTPRADARDHLLAVVAAGGLEVAAARLAPTSLSEPSSLGEVEVAGDPPGAGSAVLFGQAVSFPDAERWGQWAWKGSWDGSSFAVRVAPARTGLPPTPGVLDRWRRQRALEKACRAGLAG